MFAYSPTRRREANTAMNSSDAWSGTPVLVPAPAPSLELGIPSAWNNGKSSGRLIGELDLAATPAAVRLARTYVRELVGQHFGADRSELRDLELLTSEAMTNSVLHARPRQDGTITLSVMHIDRYVRVEVADGGAALGRPRGVQEPLPVHGRGLQLMKALATDFGTHRTKNGATFWFGVGVREGWRLP
ncbi:anti-sigma regulatory factor (Ser/Thr protein kinase) [Actinomadura pelletieri DSM 43383]|uniref:ATP-binding protein n=3 Tax=Thermomonosporaceae TaxID=2012 RepID=A0A372GDB9_9ACTN|nr:ATP-binding protein [Actinomadura spongiicola]RKS77095.1 anti-sigma regulatory factor (Ser/Thr protein kinase) [Actinomadura pelletieri DSM 43383]